MLLVILPLALIHASISVNKDPVAVGFPVSPVALINIIVGVRHATLPIEKPVLCLPLVGGSVREYNMAEAFPIFAVPLSLVLSTGSSLIIVTFGYGLEVIDPIKVLSPIFIIEELLKLFMTHHGLIQVSYLLFSIFLISGFFQLCIKLVQIENCRDLHAISLM